MNRTSLTEKDIKIGVWTYGEVNTEKNVPSISYSEIPENVDQLDRLWINIGAWTGLPEKEFSVHKKEWIKILPTLKNIKFLWVKGSINQDFFDTICKMNWLEALNIQGLTSFKNLNNINSLQKLLHLKIGRSSKLENIDSISNLNNLITLQVEGFKLISDISPITKIKSLKGLHIKGDMWKKQYIDSVNGLENLTELEYFSLSGTEVKIKDITPITKLKKLKNLEIGYWWTKSDLQVLYNSLPSLLYGSIKEAGETGEYEKYLKPIK